MKTAQPRKPAPPPRHRPEPPRTPREFRRDSPPVKPATAANDFLDFSFYPGMEMRAPELALPA